MGVSNKFSRRIVVDGVAYRWRVPGAPGYWQAAFCNPMTATVWRDGGPTGGVLRLTAGGPRPDNWLGRPGVVLRPRQVAAAVRAAVAAGWTPTSGGTFHLTLPPDEPAR